MTRFNARTPQIVPCFSFEGQLPVWTDKEPPANHAENL
jgi:hypothetical protein